MEREVGLVAARLTLGVATTHEIVGLANRILASGLYSPALDQIVDTSSPTVAEVAPLFHTYLGELGAEPPTADSAITALIHAYLGQIVDGTLTPRDGMRRVVEDAYHGGQLFDRDTKDVGDCRDLQTLIGAYYAYDDIESRPHEVSLHGKVGDEAIRENDQLIITEAQRWLRDR